jgi:ribosomal protein L44E
MSAPFGRIVDRHIKLLRYRNHPLIVAGEKIKEPLLHLVAVKPSEKSEQAKRRQQRSQRKKGPKKQANAKTSSTKQESKSAEHRSSKMECPDCGSNAFTNDGPRTKRCNICLTEWV